MYSVTHAAVGGALGAALEVGIGAGGSVPVGGLGWGGVAFAVGIVSHAALDALPHHDLKDVRLDVGLTLGALAGLAAAGHLGTAVFWGALGAVVPDLEILFWRLGWIEERHWVFPSHNGRIPHGRALGRRWILPQALVALGAYAVALWTGLGG